MPLDIQVLCPPGGDSAALVRIDTGQTVHRLLFDCGNDCLDTLDFSEVWQLDQVYFSHLHMDHIAGFDALFRALFAREQGFRLSGPPHTARILHHRFRGYMWNLQPEESGPWIVEDVFPDRIESWISHATDGFETIHQAPSRPFTGLLTDTPDFRVEALHMHHDTPSLAYIVRTPPRQNIDVTRLSALGLSPGPWLKELKQGGGDPLLRAQLLVETPGESVAYLTDFLLDDLAMQRLVPALTGCKTVVCESQYSADDLELAVRNQHMTCVQAAELARRAAVQELILFHLSPRYTPEQWPRLLDEARAIFPATRFPSHWRID